MKFMSKSSVLALSVSALLAAPAAFATNGMLLEGYGARATAMGGASTAYDTGNSAAINNPATLILMQDKKQRIGLGIRNLRPDVKSSMNHPMMGHMEAESDGTSYIMPSLSYARRTGNMAYGLAMLAQGGMGTIYKAESFLSMGTGAESMSELSVGGLMMPLAYQVNDKLSIGATLIFAWAGMDIRMAAPGDQLTSMMTGGTMQPQFEGAINGGMVQAARFDFANGNSFTGMAKGSGFDANFGLLYQLNPQFSVGASYRFKTALSDLEANGATLAGYMANPDGSMSRIDQMAMSGTLKVVDFQWPGVLALGAAYQVNPQLLVVADVKRVFWSDVMESFNMSFQAYPEFGGGTLDVTMPQNWDDQTVFSLGAEYWVNQQVALRAGVNLADNPIPDTYMNPLFPAIIKSHYTFGLGYRINANSAVDLSVTYAPEVTQTNASGITVDHSQFNWSANYSYSF